MSSPDHAPDLSPTIEPSPVTCPGCGCLCDDVRVELEPDGDRVRSFSAECALGRSWFERAVGMGVAGPEATVAGVESGRESALARVAELLHGARRPVVYGLTSTTTEAVREALALADRLGALVLPAHAPGASERIRAFADVGRVGATLGEVKNRADLVVFWGCDPVRTHPRHGERYSIEAPGRFLPKGRADRAIVVVDDRPNETSRTADLVVPLRGDRDVTLTNALRWLEREPEADIARLASACGLATEALAALLRCLQAARYGAVFYQPRTTDRPDPTTGWETMSLLVRELNRRAKIVLMGLGAGGNGPGAEAALTWQAGYPLGVDFWRGYPTPADERETLERVLAAREVDALIIVADPVPDSLLPAARAYLDQIPVIAIAPNAPRWTRPAPAIALASATFGVDVTGTVTRADGVVLPLRPLRKPRLPSDREWLGLIRQSVGEEQGNSACRLPGPARSAP